jgi:hypothetical protein
VDDHHQVGRATRLPHRVERGFVKPGAPPALSLVGAILRIGDIVEAEQRERSSTNV